MLPVSKDYAMFPAGSARDFENLPTPLYYYDTGLLEETLRRVSDEASRYDYHIHYALKANTNPKILEAVRKHHLGADCVSGGEVKAAVEAGFAPGKIVFAGVGKSDEEMLMALSYGIFCFNCESVQEIEVLNGLAKSKKTKARIAL